MDEANPNPPEPVDASSIDELPDGLSTTEPTASGGQTVARRGLIVVAALAMVIAGAVALAVRGGDDAPNTAAESDDAATDTDGDDSGSETADSDADGSDADDSDADDADTSEARAEGATEDEAAESDDMAALDGDAMTSTSDVAFYGGEAPLAWGDGFLSIRQDFVPSEVNLEDIVPDLAERFPAEVVEAIEAAGLDLGDANALEEASAVLEEAGLLDEVTKIFESDPALLEAYTEVWSGGSYAQVAEYSADGITWEPINFSFEVGENSWPQYRSNGSQLMAVVTNGDWDDEGRRTDVSITVHLTSDLVTWTSVDLPVDVPEAGALEQVDVYVEQVALSNDRWYVSVSAQRYVDLWRALPERIRDGNYSWYGTPEGVVIEDWNDEAWMEAHEAAEESGDYEAIEDWEATIVETIPWSDLPITFEEWQGNQEHSGDRFAFVGTAAGDVAPAAAPEGLEWYQLAGTADGFLAWGQVHVASDQSLTDLLPDLAERFSADEVEAIVAAAELGYTELESGGDAAIFDEAYELLSSDEEALQIFFQVLDGGTYESQAFFSADGASWSPVSLPESGWVDSVAAVEGGLLAVVSSEQGGQQFWVGDAAAGAWEQVDGPDLGENQWFYLDPNISTGTGVAALIETGHEDQPQFVSWTSTVDHDGYTLTLSADGEGSQTIQVVEQATGAVLLDETEEVYEQRFIQWTDEGVELIDAAGETILSLPSSVAEEFLWRAESEAWEAYWEANPYVPELTLVATVDGREWVVQKLDMPASEDGWYGGGGAAINGGVVVYRDPNGWQRVTVG